MSSKNVDNKRNEDNKKQDDQNREALLAITDGSQGIKGRNWEGQQYNETLPLIKLADDSDDEELESARITSQPTEANSI